jgi:photosystem II stability/assembly factor-like uncharacterized protein
MTHREAKHTSVRHWLLHAVIVIIIALPAALEAQWKKVASNLFGYVAPPQSAGWGGVLHCKDGKVWATRMLGEGLWMSEDTGKTWTRTLPHGYMASSGILTDVSFYDKFRGVIAADGGGESPMVTLDGGQSWKQILQKNGVHSFSGGNMAFFLGSERIVFGAAHLFFVYSASGKYIREIKLPQNYVAVDGHWIGGGSAIVSLMSMAVDKNNPGYTQFFYTSDYGDTWTTRGNLLEYDCWSFDFDKCDTNTLFVVNESAMPYPTNDAFSAIYRSTNRGVSWDTTIVGPSDTATISPYLSGSIVDVPGAVFAQTRTAGILRSTDKGNTWKDIGGPHIGYDTRFVSAFNANIVFAVDSFGNVWATFNSGGDPVKLFSLDRDTLFDGVRLTSCDSSVKNTVKLSLTTCEPLSKTEIRIVGSKNYWADSLRGDSIDVTFSPTDLTDTSKGYLIIASNGQVDTVHLQGITADYRNIIECITEDQSNDTLGGTIDVQFTLMNAGGQHDIEFVVHYDLTPNLVYLGSFSPNGVPLDITGEQWDGRSKLRVAKINVGVTGYSHFRVFADTVERPRVWFDSFSIKNTLSPCDFGNVDATMSIITLPSGCGISILSKFLRTGMPEFKLFPNPAEQTITIESSVDLSETTVEIIDQLGKRLMLRNEDLHAATSSTIDVRSLVNGMYILRITSKGFTTTRSFLISR